MGLDFYFYFSFNGVRNDRISSATTAALTYPPHINRTARNFLQLSRIHRKSIRKET